MARRGKYRVARSAMVTALAVVLVACASSGDEDAGLDDLEEVAAGPTGEESSGEVRAEEESPPEPPPEPAEEASEENAPTDLSDIDITTVPDEITEDYVQAVLDELERILAEALVLMMEEGELTLMSSDLVGEVFAEDQVPTRREELVAASEQGFPGMREPEEIEPRWREVIAVIDSSPDCIYVETLAHDSAFFVDSREPVPSFVVLRPHEAVRPVDINPTPWVYSTLAVGEPDELRGDEPCR